MRKHTLAIKINCMGSIRRVDLLIFVYRLFHYKQMELYAISEDPNKVPAFCGISFRSAMFAFLKVKIISSFWYNILVNNGASWIIIIWATAGDFQQ